MKYQRPASQRGRIQHAGHPRLCTFSSGRFIDRDWRGFGVLRQLNEDCLPAGAVIAPQRVANMELLTLVLDGSLLRDGVELGAGALAWTGAGHASEVPAETAGVQGARLLRIGLQPAHVNLPPARGVRSAVAAGQGWCVLAAPEGEVEGALPIRQQAWLRQAAPNAGAALPLQLAPDRRHWLQVLRGCLAFEGATLMAGDALGWHGETVDGRLVAGAEGADVLLLTLPD